LRRAEIAEKTERYNDMAEVVKKFAKYNAELTVTERNLFSVAFKNVIGKKRTAYRFCVALEEKEQKNNNNAHVKLIQKFTTRTKDEIILCIQEVITILDDSLIPNSKSNGFKCFFLKMKGDFLRYKVEFVPLSIQKTLTDQVVSCYKKAQDISKTLPGTDPIRLGLALNYSVCCKELLHENARACDIAKTAFDTALMQLDELSEDSYKDAALIMQLLRDNLTLWTT